MEDMVKTKTICQRGTEDVRIEQGHRIGRTGCQRDQGRAWGGYEESKVRKASDKVLNRNSVEYRKERKSKA